MEIPRAGFESVAWPPNQRMSARAYSFARPLFCCQRAEPIRAGADIGLSTDASVFLEVVVWVFGVECLITPDVRNNVLKINHFQLLSIFIPGCFTTRPKMSEVKK